MNVPDTNPQPRSPAPQIDPVFIWPTPERQDLLFWVEKNADLPKNKTWAFGDAYPDAVRYPNHKLIYVEPQTPSKWSKWYYASDRINEDNYNWEINSGDELIRTYLVPRAKYRQRAAGSAGLLSGEFTYPPVGTADSAFANYGFADDTQVRADSQLDSIYVIIRRRFLIPEVVEYQYDPNIERHVKITRTIVARNSVTPSISAGNIIDVQPVNVFRDTKITKQVQWLPGDLSGGNPAYPIQLRKHARSVSYNFPPYLRAIKVIYSEALATSQAAPASYSYDWFLFYDIIDPANGPYRGFTLRFLTDDPAAVEAAYPVMRILTRREVLGLACAWGVGSNYGNSTFAQARQFEVPASIHGDIPIQNSTILGIVNLTDAKLSPSLKATPGFDEVIGASEMIVDCKTLDTAYGLSMVEITIINTAGVYENRWIGDDGNTYTDPPPDSDISVATPSGVFNADGSEFSGAATPLSTVELSVAGVVLASTTADSSGQFTLTLDPRLGNGQTVSVTATLRGAVSDPFTATAPTASAARPVAWMNSAMDTVTGYAPKGSEVHILTAGIRQSVTVDLSASHEPTADGNILVAISSALFDSTTITVAVLDADTVDDYIGKIETAVAAAVVTKDGLNYDLTDFLTPDGDTAADTFSLTAVAAAANDASLEITLSNDPDNDPNIHFDGAAASPISSDPLLDVAGVAPTEFTVTANATTGAFSRSGIAGITAGDEITVYAVDEIGPSSNLTIEASSSPPAAPDPTSPATHIINQTTGATAAGDSASGTTVTAYEASTLASLGSGASSGTFSFSLSPVQTDGETVYFQAKVGNVYSSVDAGSTDTAPTLTPLEMPYDVLQLGQIANQFIPGFAGNIDEDPTYGFPDDIEIILPDTSRISGATIYEDVPSAGKGRFIIQPASASTIFYQGEQIQIVAHYDPPGTDSRAVVFRFPTAVLARPAIELLPRPVGRTSGSIRNLGLWGGVDPRLTWRIDVSTPIDVTAAMTAAGFVNRLKVSFPGSDIQDITLSLLRADQRDFRKYYARLTDDNVTGKTWEWATSNAGTITVPVFIEVVHEWGKPGSTILSPVTRWSAADKLQGYKYVYE